MRKLLHESKMMLYTYYIQYSLNLIMFFVLLMYYWYFDTSIKVKIGTYGPNTKTVWRKHKIWLPRPPVYYQPGPPVPQLCRLTVRPETGYRPRDGGVLFKAVIQRRVFDENNGNWLGASWHLNWLLNRYWDLIPYCATQALIQIESELSLVKP